MIETYDKITIHQGYSLGISEMGKDIGPDWREVNSGNGITASISGDSVTNPEGIHDLGAPNRGLNDCNQLVIQVVEKSNLLKIV
jgi:hypothetical protein